MPYNPGLHTVTPASRYHTNNQFRDGLKVPFFYDSTALAAGFRLKQIHLKKNKMHVPFINRNFEISIPDTK